RLLIAISLILSSLFYFFFFNDPAPPHIYTLSLHDALPISSVGGPDRQSLFALRANSPFDRPNSNRARCQSSFRRRNSEHVLHRVKLSGFSEDPLRRTQSTARKNFATAGPMR